MRRAAWLVVLVAVAAFAGDGALGDIGKQLDKGVKDAEKQLKKEGEKVEKKASEMSAEEKKCSDLANKPVPVEDELAMGGAVAVNLVAKNGLVTDLGGKDGAALKKGAAPPADAPANQLSRYINLVGRMLAAHSERPMLEWKFGILKNETVNAWSAPGGYVFVTTGLLRNVTSEDQLAGVLAHEIAHVAHRDALKEYAAYKNAECKAVYFKPVGEGVSKGLDSAGKSPLADLFKKINIDLGAAANVDLLKVITDFFVKIITEVGLGREAEVAADKTATELLILSGYSVREYMTFLEKLPGGGFSTHPSGKDRAATVFAYAKARAEDPFTPPPNKTAKPLGDEMKHLASIK